jgi:hypothetical protein
MTASWVPAAADKLILPGVVQAARDRQSAWSRHTTNQGRHTVDVVYGEQLCDEGLVQWSGVDTG